MIFGFGSALVSFSQDEIVRTEIAGGKLKYEYRAVKERLHLIKSFFNKYDVLYDGSSAEFIIEEGSATAVARITKNGFEIVGDSEDKKFSCENAEILIDLWYEYSHKNSD